tara:strand:+ start:1834 stop:1980 length:147 start_codon:yes stop_codon:yes gene_type:complete
MLKSAYKYLWVPIMGRFLSVFIALLEGKQPKKLPTYKIDGNNSTYNKK